MVLCIGGTDPTTYLSSAMCDLDDETALYVRGDDMPNFPARPFIETIMPICLLPDTNGVSSTQIRKLKFAHVRNDDDVNNELHL
jgi:hypothetical protein